MNEVFTDRAADKRFELDVEGMVVFANYRIDDGQTLYIDHVEAPPALRGTGAAGRLMHHIVNHAAAHRLAITPVCGYAASWLRRHGKQKDAHDAS